MIIKKFCKFNKVTITNSKIGHFSVVPGFGAAITEISLKHNHRKFPIIDGAKSYSEIIAEKGFKSAILVPFPNRIRDGKYNFKNRTFRLLINHPKDDCAIHGLLYDRKFKIKSCDSNSITLCYTYDKESAGFPFKFYTEIKCTLKRGFQIEFTVKNLDKTGIPMGIGWHPYFRLGRTVDDLYLEIPSSKKFITDKRMIPIKEAKNNLFTKMKRIGRAVLDTGFIVNSPMTELLDKKDNVKLVFWQETGTNKFNYLQVYTPPSRKSIAIEPMTCAANAFNNKKGLIILKPGKKIKLKCGVYLE